MKPIMPAKNITGLLKAFKKPIQALLRFPPEDFPFNFMINVIKANDKAPSNIKNIKNMPATTAGL